MIKNEIRRRISDTAWMFWKNINPTLSAITPAQLVWAGVMAF